MSWEVSEGHAPGPSNCYWFRGVFSQDEASSFPDNILIVSWALCYFKIERKKTGFIKIFFKPLKMVLNLLWIINPFKNLLKTLDPLNRKTHIDGNSHPISWNPSSPEPLIPDSFIYLLAKIYHSNGGLIMFLYLNQFRH